MIYLSLERSLDDLGQKETSTTEMEPDNGTAGVEEQQGLTSHNDEPGGTQEHDRWAYPAATAAPSECCRDQVWPFVGPRWVEGELPEFLDLDSVAGFHGDHPRRELEARSPTFLSAAGSRPACDHDSHRTHAGGCRPDRGAVANDAGMLVEPGAVAPFHSSSGHTRTAAACGLPNAWQERSGQSFPSSSRRVVQRRSTTWLSVCGGSDVAML